MRPVRARSRRQRMEELLGIEPSGFDDFPPLYDITPGVGTWIARAKDGKRALYSYLDPKPGSDQIGSSSSRVPV